MSRHDKQSTQDNTQEIIIESPAQSEAEVMLETQPEVAESTTVPEPTPTPLQKLDDRVAQAVALKARALERARELISGALGVGPAALASAYDPEKRRTELMTEFLEMDDAIGPMLERILELETKITELTAPKASSQNSSGRGNVGTCIVAVLADRECAYLSNAEVAELVSAAVPGSGTTAGSVACYPTRDKRLIGRAIPRIRVL